VGGGLIDVGDGKEIGVRLGPGGRGLGGRGLWAWPGHAHQAPLRAISGYAPGGALGQGAQAVQSVC